MNNRVYKFITAKYGVDDLKNRRLKLSTIDDLNDPFDHYAIDTSNSKIAYAVAAAISEFKRDTRLVCFSRNWDNILLWSHYAASHTGLCLGFDIPDRANFYLDVRYQPNLLRFEDLTGNLQDPAMAFDFAKRLVSTKHESWSYEQEVRIFIRINDPSDQNGLSWIPFDPMLELKEVIIGVQCNADDVNNVCEVLKGYPEQIECTWAYMRSDAFLLIRSKTTHANAFRPSERAFALRRDIRS